LSILFLWTKKTERCGVSERAEFPKVWGYDVSFQGGREAKRAIGGIFGELHQRGCEPPSRKPDGTAQKSTGSNVVSIACLKAVIGGGRGRKGGGGREG